MGSNNIIVREYLESLKEDKELDYLFPIVLNAMGFRIVATPKESKGQSQYGKDIIAIGKDEKGNEHRWYFELKGYSDKDITDSNYSKKDGVRESIIEAKDTDFNDFSIPQFNHLPIKIIFVHNGIIKSNIRPTFEGFIKKAFNDGEFERWDIYHLTDIFSKYLFNEYLLTDKISIKLFKRTLVFLDAPDYDFSDLKQLINKQLEQLEKNQKQNNNINSNSRAFKIFFATLNLMALMIINYSRENNNLYPAKQCLSILVLRIWAWILSNDLEKDKKTLEQFSKLLKLQGDLLNDYFDKTYPIASIENGLYAEHGAFFEKIGFPLRSFDYLSDLLYYSYLKLHLSNYKKDSIEYIELKNELKNNIIVVVENNEGCKKPVIDNHSIPISILLIFFLDKNIRDEDLIFIGNFMYDILDNINIVKYQEGRYPELYNNIDILVEYCYSDKRPSDYQDNSSILIATIFEFLAVLNAKQIYEQFQEQFSQKISLQIPFFVKDLSLRELEILLFSKTMHQEYYVELIDLPKSFTEFYNNIKSLEINETDFYTDNAGFEAIRVLAHLFNKNELSPNKWRRLIQF